MTESQDFIVQMAEPGQRGTVFVQGHTASGIQVPIAHTGKVVCKCACVYLCVSVWIEEAHLAQPPAGLQLMACKLKADSEEWGPAAESRPIAQRLYKGSTLVRVSDGQETSHQACSPLPPQH